MVANAEPCSMEESDHLPAMAVDDEVMAAHRGQIGSECRREGLNE